MINKIDATHNVKLLTVSLLFSVILFVAKFTAYYITGSNAILSDALESVVNILAGGISLASVLIASLPKDQNHPYGHGKVEFLSAGFEGGFILLAGLIIIVKAVYNLFYPNTIQHIQTGIIIILCTALVNYIIGYLLVLNGTKNSSAATVANGKHLMTDTYSTLGLFLGLLIIWITGIAWLDQIVAMLLGGYILYTGYNILKDALSGILDETDNKLIEEIVTILENNRNTNWIDIHNLRIIKYGASLHIDCHITLPYYLDLKKAHKEVTAIEQLVNSKMPNHTEFFIHIDPCEPLSCSVCTKTDCEVRAKPFIQRVIWNRDNVAINKKHFK